jgi:carbonic anhydrase
MSGLLQPDALAKLPSVASWLQLARPTLARLNATCSEATPLDERLARCVEVNALCQLDNLRAHPAVSAALAKGAINLHAWVYDIGSGKIRSYDETERSFVDLQ